MVRELDGTKFKGVVVSGELFLWVKDPEKSGPILRRFTPGERVEDWISRAWEWWTTSDPTPRRTYLMTDDTAIGIINNELKEKRK